jgi:hypothetical protein
MNHSGEEILSGQLNNFHCNLLNDMLGGQVAREHSNVLQLILDSNPCIYIYAGPGKH